MRRIHALSVGFIVVAVAGLAFAQGSAKRRASPGTDAQIAAELQADCDDGDCAACGRLAEMYRRGEGVPRDEGRAERLQEKDCGHSRARRGHETVKAEVRAGHDSRRALVRDCDRGDSLACRKLGSMYENGDGVAKDDSRAAHFFRKACDGGRALGCFRLGLLHDLGHGVVQDWAIAARLYRRSCDGGVAFGCHNLAGFHEMGRVVAKDMAAAAKLYQRACELGFEASCEKARALREHAKPTQQGGAKPASHPKGGKRHRR